MSMGVISTLACCPDITDPSIY